MKKTLLCILISLFIVSVSFSQEKFKFGNSPKELVEMTVYEKDPDATAVVIYENTDVHYELSLTEGVMFDIITEYVVRIKIFSQDGISHASGAIPYIRGSRGMNESVSGLQGWTYNMENGKVDKTKLSKEYIFTEDVSDRLKLTKFAMPAVKAGSVIEYKYKKISPYFTELDQFVFQRSIPVEYSFLSIRIPDYFTFHKEEKGYEFLNVKSEKVNENFTFAGFPCSAEKVTAEARDLPALKDESFVWNYRDYLARIVFEIRSAQFPGALYKDFQKSWASVAGGLMNSEYFGEQFEGNKNLLKSEIAQAIAESGATNDIDSIRSILNLVRSKVKWNDRTALGAKNLNKALKEGIGNSGEINTILICALRNSGYSAFPVVMSTRSNGRLPMTHPSSDKLNYAITCVYSGFDYYFLDATKSYTDLNVIPTDCMVDRAMLIRENGFEWEDLTKIGSNSERIKMMYRFDEDGVLKGQIALTHYGEPAYSFKSRYDRSESEDKYIENKEEKDAVAVNNYKLDTRYKPTFGFVESYEFRKDDIRLDGGVISFNPLLFLAMKSNAFSSETRKLPVEFPYPYEQQININFEIPEGYVLDEMPESERFVYEDELIEFSYIIQQSDNLMQLVYRLKLNTVVVPVTQYTILRNFWSKMYNKESEMITLVKGN